MKLIDFTIKHFGSPNDTRSERAEARRQCANAMGISYASFDNHVSQGHCVVELKSGEFTLLNQKNKIFKLKKTVIR